MPVSAPIGHMLATAFLFSAETWLSIFIGAIVTFAIGFIIYWIQRKEGALQKQEHDAKLAEIKELHQQDSEKIRVLYDLILKSQSGSIGEAEANALEKEIEAAADTITEHDSDQAQALKAIADKDKDKADDLLEKISQKEHELEELYNLHAINEHRHGNYPDAVPWLQKLVELKPDNPKYKERLYVDLSNSGFFEQAKTLAQNALSQCEANPQTPPDRMVRWLRNLAATYMNLGKQNESEAYLNRAMEYGNKNLGPEHIELYAIHNDLGCLSLERGDFVKAEQYFRTALSIHRIEDEDDQIHHAYMICNMGTALKGQERFEEAVKLYQDGVKDIINQFGDDHPVLTFYYGHLGGFWYSQKDFPPAREMFLKTLAIFEHKHMYANPAMQSAMTMLGHICLAMKNYDESIKYYLDSIKNQEQYTPDNIPRLIRTRHYLAEAYLDSGQTEQAETWLEKVIADWNALTEPDKVNLKQAYEQLAELKTQAGKTEEAAACRAKAAEL